MTPFAAMAAKVREWPILPISLGVAIQPMRKPAKCAEPRRPISLVENPLAAPESASSGPSKPMPNCTKATETNKAAKEKWCAWKGPTRLMQATYGVGDNIATQHKKRNKEYPPEALLRQPSPNALAKRHADDGRQ